MIKEIHLKNFKCFKDATTIPLSKINILTGVNGRGKSTVLQSIILMRQSIEHSEYTNKIVLNGKLLNLGTSNDIRNASTKREDVINIGFKISTVNSSSKLLSYVLQASEDAKYELMIKDITLEKKDKDSNMAKLYNLLPASPEFADAIRSLEINFRRIHYIAADRNGPKRYYEKISLGDFPQTGSKGEYVANVLEILGDLPKIVNDELFLGEGIQTVTGQTIEWLRAIFGKANLKLIGAREDYPVLSLEMNSDDSINQFTQPNVGFGYSYILPIIISGLISKPGEILIIENPEAHLHPKAQARVASFLAKVAKTGVQVILESHSDHILNGLRIAIKEKTISVDDLKILFFHDSVKDIIKELKVDKNGDINEWPEDFFDQQEIDLQRLMRS